MLFLKLLVLVFDVLAFLLSMFDKAGEDWRGSALSAHAGCGGGAYLLLLVKSRAGGRMAK